MRNGREMGNETEFETRKAVNGKRDEKRYIIFQQKNEKKRGKNEKNQGEKTLKNMKKQEEKKKIIRNTETRF